MNNSLYLFVPLIYSTFIYDGVAIAGIGIPVLLLMATLIHSTVHLAGKNRRAVSFMRLKTIRNPFLLYIGFSTIFLFAQLYNTNTTGQTFVYWAALAAQALWFPATWWITQNTKGRIEHILDISIILVVATIAIFWLFGAVQTLDPFFLRNSIDHFETVFIAPDLLSNPNRTARTLILLLMYSMYKSRSSGTKTWAQLNLILSILLILTLSRSGIASMIILWTIYSLDFERLKEPRMVILSLTVLVICFLLLTPKIGDSIENAIATISTVGDYYGSGIIDARNMSIRARSWSASIQIIQDNPLFGVGVSNALDTLGFYGSTAYKGGTELQTIWVHGGFLKISVYAGLTTLLVFIAVLLSLLHSFYREYKRAHRNAYVKAESAAWIGIAGLAASIPVNIGADFYGLGIVWLVFSYLIARSAISN